MAARSLMSITTKGRTKSSTGISSTVRPSEKEKGVHVRADVFPISNLVQVDSVGLPLKTGLTSTMAGGTKVLFPRVVTSSPSLNQAGKSGCKVWLKSTTREKGPLRPA